MTCPRCQRSHSGVCGIPPRTSTGGTVLLRDTERDTKPIATGLKPRQGARHDGRNLAAEAMGELRRFRARAPSDWTDAAIDLYDALERTARQERVRGSHA